MMGCFVDLTLAALWMERANSGQSLMIAYQLWSDMGEQNRAVAALTKSGQMGYVPALRALVAMTLPICDSLLLYSSASLWGHDSNNEAVTQGEITKYKEKLLQDIKILLSVNPCDKNALITCQSENHLSCESILMDKVEKWLLQAVKMGCEDSKKDLQELQFRQRHTLREHYS